MKKAFALLIGCFFCLATLQAQKIRFGLYAGTGFTQVKSDAMEISTLPITEGGLNLHLGAHVNIPIVQRLELETGLHKVTRGYTYRDYTGFSQDQYTKIQCLSIPIVAVYHLLDYPDEVPFRLSIGLGVYGSYALSGRITGEDGTSQKAGFSNARRNEFGPRWMMKWEFLHRVEAYIANDLRSTNVIKNGSASLKMGSLQIGLGVLF